MKQNSFRRLRAACLMLPLTVGFVLLLTGCQHRMFSADDGCEGIVYVHVDIAWDDDEYSTRPSANGMMVQLFPAEQPAVREAGRYALPVDGGFIRVGTGTEHHPVCYDYESNRTVYYRNEQSREHFEAYCQSATGTYNQYADMQPGEVTVAEPLPRTLYMVRNDETFTVDALPGDTLELRFEPDNVLREYTFLIYGIEGLANVADIKGAISNMAASYFPAQARRSDNGSTILFTGIDMYTRGQQRTWSEQQLRFFPAGWDDPVTGWTGDWIIGRFCAFGMVDPSDLRNRLTIECLTPATRYYYASWGYWLGQWEETVSNQLWATTGTHGTLEEQQAWRAVNGGFDIVLANDGRLIIPQDEDEGDNDGFDIDVGEWDNVIVPLG
ncbi:MAG: DUF5119 domain-containing protein [Prevotellaceae bacterium]|jgi:hypothetical protein|nr:DUF5119 domain-containing protein [Prevotellaceae bacterium]